MFEFLRHCYGILVVAAMVLLLSCGNKSRQPEPYILEWASEEETTDTVAVETDKVAVEEGIEAPSAPTAPSAPSRPSSSSHSSSSDNMRGFDPASEDDMDDNGMSRYMENTDDEGWD